MAEVELLNRPARRRRRALRAGIAAAHRLPDRPRPRWTDHRSSPRLPEIELDPDLVLLAFLPPPLQAASYDVSPRRSASSCSRSSRSRSCWSCSPSPPCDRHTVGCCLRPRRHRRTDRSRGRRGDLPGAGRPVQPVHSGRRREPRQRRDRDRHLSARGGGRDRRGRFGGRRRRPVRRRGTGRGSCRASAGVRRVPGLEAPARAARWSSPAR